MKTLIEIKQAIFDMMEVGKTYHPVKDKSRINKTKKSLQFLRKAETYLMTNPDAQFIKIELTKVKKRIGEVESKGPLGSNGRIITRTKPTPEERKAIKAYDKLEGLEKFRDFKKFLTYLNS